MKNFMFLMLVLLHITSQPAQRSIAPNTLITFGAIGIMSVGVIACSKGYTHFKEKDRRIPIFTEDKTAKLRHAYNGAEDKIDIDNGANDSVEENGCIRSLSSNSYHQDNTQGVHSRTAFSSASHTGRVGIVQSLLKIEEKQRGITISTCHIDNGAKEKSDINARDENGQTVIERMVWEGNLEGVTSLIDSKADVNGISQDGVPLLHLAVRRGTPETVAYLIDNGADIGEYGFTFLHWSVGKAILRGSVDSAEKMVALLIRYGVKPSRQSQHDFRLLNCALHHGTSKMVTLLIGNDVEIYKEDFKPCLDILYNLHLIREGMDECEFSKMQFEEYLKEQELYERAQKSKNFDKIKKYYKWLPEKLKILINVFAEAEISDKNCLRRGAQIEAR